MSDIPLSLEGILKYLQTDTSASAQPSAQPARLFGRDLQRAEGFAESNACARSFHEPGAASAPQAGAAVENPSPLALAQSFDLARHKDFRRSKGIHLQGPGQKLPVIEMSGSIKP